MIDIRNNLEKLARLRDERADVAAPYDEQIADLEAQRDYALKGIALDIALIEAEVKDAVLVLGQTVKSSVLMAVWSKPRVSWDIKALDGYAVAHPEVGAFRKEGKPSVSIRTVRK